MATYGEISGWDVSGVSNMSGLFQDARSKSEGFKAYLYTAGAVPA